MTRDCEKRTKPIYDLAYAFDCAADFLEAEEWPEEDGGEQVAAYKAAAKRIRKIAQNTYKRASEELAHGTQEAR